MRNPTSSALAVLGLVFGVACVASPSQAATKGPATAAKATKAAPGRVPAQAPPEAVSQLADWVIASNDHSDMPFVIIDKVAAKVFVYRADGQLRGSAPALLGYARGDNSSPGVGDRELSDIKPADRTTPAGRFVASYGRGSAKSKVLWVDYSTAISMHPVVTAHPAERRPQRLQSATPRDNRITYGCINVSPVFYDKVVRRTFATTNGIVYILPEKQPLDQVFPAYAAVARAAAISDHRDAAGVSNETHPAPTDAGLAR